MTKKRVTPTESEEPVVASTSEPNANVEPIPELSTANPEERIAAVEAEKAEIHDRMLRIAADFDNWKKRARRDQADGEARTKESVLRDFLEIVDGLERADRQSAHFLSHTIVHLGGHVDPGDLCLGHVHGHVQVHAGRGFTVRPAHSRGGLASAQCCCDTGLYPPRAAKGLPHR